MINNPYSYTVEKLTGALECLATHPGDARHRIAAVYSQIHMLHEDDFPAYLMKDWLWTIEQITRFGPLTDESGSVIRDALENTVRKSKNASASKIAKCLYKLYWAISRNTEYE